MIEIPEAFILTRQINQTLGGKHIKKALANHSPHKFAWFSGDPADYNLYESDGRLHVPLPPTTLLLANPFLMLYRTELIRVF